MFFLWKKLSILESPPNLKQTHFSMELIFIYLYSHKSTPDTHVDKCNTNSLSLDTSNLFPLKQLKVQVIGSQVYKE